MVQKHHRKYALFEQLWIQNPDAYDELRHGTDQPISLPMRHHTAPTQVPPELRYLLARPRWLQH
jgi:hypothetical protein